MKQILTCWWKITAGRSAVFLMAVQICWLVKHCCILKKPKPAELEGAGASMYTFTMQPDGSLFSGRDAGPVLRELETAGAAAVGFNCVAADMMTPYLVSKLRRSVKGPLICKPNAGVPTIGSDGIPYYPQPTEEFASIVKNCHANGATVLGGCCGTAPEYIAAVRNILK